jgi:fluoroacetyl-CoA thioesterase
MRLVPGLRASLDRMVTDADTAEAVGSGDVPVLATPRLLAWAEEATLAVLAGRLNPASTTVGVAVALRHLEASTVGRTVVLTAELAEIDDEVLEFDVSAHDTSGRVLATGTVTRMVVDRARFAARANHS